MMQILIRSTKKGDNKMHRLLIVAFILLFHSLTYADDLDGYRGTSWGMSRSEVVDVLKKQGLNYSSGLKTITVEDNLFGKKATITYHVGLLNPLTEVDIYLYSDRKDLPAKEITNSLIEKYGRSIDMVCGDDSPAGYLCFAHWLLRKTAIKYSANPTIIDIKYTYSTEAEEKNKKIKDKL